MRLKIAEWRADGSRSVLRAWARVRGLFFGGAVLLCASVACFPFRKVGIKCFVRNSELTVGQTDRFLVPCEEFGGGFLRSLRECFGIDFWARRVVVMGVWLRCNLSCLVWAFPFFRLGPPESHFSSVGIERRMTKKRPVR